MTRSRLITLVLFVSLLGWFAWGLYAAARQASLDKKLIVAVDTFNVPAVKRLLAEGADPDTREGGDPPPSWRQRLAAMLGRGATHVRHRGRPVLVAAAIWPSGSLGRPDPDPPDARIIAMLVAARADVNARSDIPPSPFHASGDTALIETCRNNLFATALTPSEKTLLDAGADVNIADDGGSTALQAAIFSDVPLVQALLDHGAHVDAANSAGWTPLIEEAALSPMDQPADISRILLAQGASIDARDIHGDTALIWAADRNQFEIARCLLTHSADINAQDHLGLTPLMHAADQSGFQAARLLIAQGADVNIRDNAGRTVLWHFRRWIHVGFEDQPQIRALMALLIKHGAKG
jgi:ankyrin repeat protein